MMDYRKLKVWALSMELVLDIYKYTGNFPKEELYGLISQMRRAAVSIPSNIAEGRRRGSQKEFRAFLRIAYGSGAELETQLELANGLEFLSLKEYKALMKKINHIQSMLNRLINIVS